MASAKKTLFVTTAACGLVLGAAGVANAAPGNGNGNAYGAIANEICNYEGLIDGAQNHGQCVSEVVAELKSDHDGPALLTLDGHGNGNAYGAKANALCNLFHDFPFDNHGQCVSHWVGFFKELPF